MRSLKQINTFLMALFFVLIFYVDAFSFPVYVTEHLSNSNIPKGKLIAVADESVLKIMPREGSSGTLLSLFIIPALTLWDIAQELDMPIDKERFGKGIDAYQEGEELYHEGKLEEAREKFLIANYRLGSVFHKEIMKQTTSLSAEIANKFHTKRQKQALELCLDFLEQAYKIKNDLKITFPQIPLYIGEILAVSGERRKAVKYLKEAGSEFTQIGKPKLAEQVNELIAVL